LDIFADGRLELMVRASNCIDFAAELYAIHRLHTFECRIVLGIAEGNDSVVEPRHPHIRVESGDLLAEHLEVLGHVVACHELDLTGQAV
jgi:hypothetical protein